MKKEDLKESLHSEYRRFCKPQEVMGCWVKLRSCRAHYKEQKAALDGYASKLFPSLQTLDEKTRASLVVSLKPYAAHMGGVAWQAVAVTREAP